MKIEFEGPKDLARVSRAAANDIVKEYDLEESGMDKTDVMVVLGSGCGEVAKKIEPITTIPYGDILGMPVSTVEGHAGELILGKYQGKNVAACSGRVHSYEGYSALVVSYLVHLGKHLGAKAVIMTTATGIAPKAKLNEMAFLKSFKATLQEYADLLPQDGDITFEGMVAFYKDIISTSIETDTNIKSRYPVKKGSLLLVESYFPNFLESSLRGPIGNVGDRFNGAINAPTIFLGDLAQDVAKRTSYELKEGIYVPRPGPNYETPAEVSLLAGWSREFDMPVLGGMSVVPELEAANMLGINSLVIALVTNQMFDLESQRMINRTLRESLGDDLLSADGTAKYSLSEANVLMWDAFAANQPKHEEVKEVAESEDVTEKLEKIIGGVVRAIRI